MVVLFVAAPDFIQSFVKAREEALAKGNLSEPTATIIPKALSNEEVTHAKEILATAEKHFDEFKKITWYEYGTGAEKQYVTAYVGKVDGEPPILRLKVRYTGPIIHSSLFTRLAFKCDETVVELDALDYSEGTYENGEKIQIFDFPGRVALKVKDFMSRRGVMYFRIHGKRRKIRYVEAHPAALSLIQDYLDAALHGADSEAPLFRPVKNNRRRNAWIKRFPQIRFTKASSCPTPRRLISQWRCLGRTPSEPPLPQTRWSTAATLRRCRNGLGMRTFRRPGFTTAVRNGRRILPRSRLNTDSCLKKREQY